MEFGLKLDAQRSAKQQYELIMLNKVIQSSIDSNIVYTILNMYII
jgi:hypothetical protein